MSLAPGTRLGPYEIIAPIGAGGMGEVYRARDSKLKRDVALKVLPEVFATDRERMARFQREAEILASLNHPNIAHIYGVEDCALIMELVEGESPKGAMPFEDAWKVALQIADALEYAHDRGIVHRDLKPANVKVSPEGVVKLLDFGLAKAFSGQDPEAQPEARVTDSPTLTLGVTVAGVIMGTAAYMAPEQAKGKRVDKRADIWSWGVMLYELLTGERLFQGDEAADTLAQVLTKKPNLERVPAKARLLLSECLQKDPKLRLRDIGDAKRLVPEDILEPTGTGINLWAWIVASIALLAATVVSFVHFREKLPVREVVRFQIPPPGKGDFGYNSIALSPDGKRLTFAAQVSGGVQLWVRSLNSLDARPLAGTDNPLGPPFWSPDSRYIAFATAGKLRRVDASGGPVQTICDRGGDVLLGGAWSREGVIVFGTSQGLVRVPEGGGVLSPLTTIDRSREARHYAPTFLPDGRHFLYLRADTGNLYESGVYAGSLDSQPAQQSSARLATSDSSLAYVPLPDSNLGHLLFVREGSLVAQPFDAGKLALVGDAIPIVEGLPTRAIPFPFSVSTNGVLAYRTGSATTLHKLMWFDRDGKVVETAGEPGEYNTVSLAPDGSRVAVSRVDGGNADIWLYEFAGGRTTRLTFDPGVDWLAVWSPDGNHIVFSSSRGGGLNLYRKPSNGAENEQPLLKSNLAKFAQDWSPDGQFLLYAQGGGSDADLWFLPLKGDAKPQPYLRTGFYDSQGRFSPDGHFIAYTSNASGKNEVYVQPFPDSSTGKWLVSKGGGVQPRWRRDGKELFYISADSKMMAVDVTTSPTFRAGIPKVLFSAPIWGGGSVQNVTRYDVTADGKRFLINSVASEDGAAAVAPMTVVLNWEELLKR
jgi:Tol biopolymer transport system component